ncbi:hypothetical protein CYLTODRAFT_367464, partial [Cylindrobasidium torrendii FP15055 ss-10]
MSADTGIGLAGQGHKRRLSFDGDDEISRKRLKESDNSEEQAVAASLGAVATTPTVDGNAFVDELAQELQCGCCAALVYRPVVVAPCQHFFCGSCCALWIRNGGTNCPACRGISTTVTPSRPLQIVLDVLLRSAPSMGRSERERQQADSIYASGSAMRIPPPREPSPPPNLNTGDYARPCPNCAPNNPYGYTCPQPIVDPSVDAERAWALEEGAPPGHLMCGNCENLCAKSAPTTTKCDFCRVSFCGLSAPTRCIAVAIHAQHLQDLTDVADLLQSPDVYECFQNNAYEVDLMIDYLNSRQMAPRHIYRDIVAHIQSSPAKFQPLFDLDLFSDLYSVGPTSDPTPNPERRRICRMCATEVLLWGLRDWWVRTRTLDPARVDCPEGGACERQKDLGACVALHRLSVLLMRRKVHAKECESVQGINRESKGMLTTC